MIKIMSNCSLQPEKVRVVAVYGSPRRNGNSSTLLDKFIEGVGESKTNRRQNIIVVDKIYVKDLNISPCRECCNCSKTGQCIINDDMQTVYKKLIDGDFLAVASPVFFTTVSGYLKALIDRCQRFWSLKYELKKRVITKYRRGIFISTAGHKSKGIFDCPIKVIRSFFDVLYVEYFGEFLVNDVDKKGEILNNKKALENIYEFGKSIVFKS